MHEMYLMHIKKGQGFDDLFNTIVWHPGLVPSFKWLNLKFGLNFANRLFSLWGFAQFERYCSKTKSFEKNTTWISLRASKLCKRLLNHNFRKLNGLVHIFFFWYPSSVNFVTMPKHILVLRSFFCLSLSFQVVNWVFPGRHEILSYSVENSPLLVRITCCTVS